MTHNTSSSVLTFRFLKVEEKPLMEVFKAATLTSFLVVILLIGLLIQSRIFYMLRKQGSDGSVIAIDRLFKAHNLVPMLSQPVLIIYLIFSHYLYPMVDYIGLPGCVIFSQFLNVFTALYYLVFPFTIAVVRLVVSWLLLQCFNVHLYI